MIRHRSGVTAKFRAAFTIWGIGVLCTMMLWGVGCSRNSSEYSQFPPNAEGIFLTGIRPPAGDTNRLLRNAHYLKLMGRPELALRELEAAYQQDPTNIRVLNALAMACDQMGEFSRAQKLYQEAQALDVSNQALNNNLCFSYYLAGQWDKAEACFRQALTRNPRNIMARNNLGLLLCRRGRTEEARRLWQDAEGEKVAQKKMQQVMAVLGIGETPRYAQLPESAPAAAKDQTPAKVALPSSPAPQLQVPAAPPAKIRKPLKLAANPRLAALPRDKGPSTPVPAAKPTPPQPKEPAAATQTQRQPASMAKASPAVTKKQSAPHVQAAAPSKIKSPPAPPKRTADTDKKPTPAVKPPPPAKPGKIKLSATPAPVRSTPAQFSQSGIEVKNGSGGYNLARQTRAMLKKEGFKVVSIGNYRDFGMDQTVIYYRPEAEKVARALNAKFFPKSRLEIGDKFAKNASVKVVLGNDLLGHATLTDESSLKAEKIAADTGSSSQKPQPVAAATTASAPAAVQAPKGRSKPYLTAAELVHTPIEIRNGSGAHNLAHMARSMLSQEGFNVARIGNHIDFGAEKTIIYYRPGAERIARNLSTKFFSNSQMEQTAKLPDDVAVKVLLGKDLLQHTDVMAKLED